MEQNKNTTPNLVEDMEELTHKQSSLTPALIPRFIIDKETNKEVPNKSYAPIIDISQKLKDTYVKNIALTGTYGSGKSSVLLTLMHDFPDYNYLNISLAMLDKDSAKETATKTTTQNKKNEKGETEHISKDETSEKGDVTPPQQDTDDKINRLIEYSILQQLIYREEHTTLPNSRFKRIKSIPRVAALKKAIYIVLFIISCIVLFQPSLLLVPEIAHMLSWGKVARNIFVGASAIYVICFAIEAIALLIRRFYNSKITRFNLKEGEVDINESTSIFNKHLDEIIYFFQETKYNVAILEDLDRFNTHKIFLKLRELNLLLNESNCIKEKITFIYAVRDNIFIDTARTKFFDYITTVIPVINPSNACDKLREELIDQDVFNELNDRICMDLGIYIDDMRILKNIVNEFVQYKDKIHSGLADKKLLGMILYKNYYPKDFVGLHYRKGFVSELFDNRFKFAEALSKDWQVTLNNLKDKIELIETRYNIINKRELRNLYVLEFLKSTPGISKVYQTQYNSNQYDISELHEDINFNLLRTNAFKFCTQNGYSNRSLNYNFSTLEKRVDKDHSYDEREELLTDNLPELRKQRRELEQRILKVRSRPIQELVKQYSRIEDKPLLSDFSDKPMILFLIQEGYIEEDYYDYISYFYPGTISSADKDFITETRVGNSLGWEYRLNKIGNLVAQIHPNAFETGAVLNISLVDYLSKHRIKYLDTWESIISTVIRYEETSFIKDYYLTSRNPKKFITEILLKWDNFPAKFLTVFDAEEGYIYLELLLKHFPFTNVDNYSVSEFKSILSSNYAWLSEHVDEIGIDNLISISKALDIKYDKLNSDHNALALEVINNDLYTITSNNIETIVNCVSPEQVIAYKKASYTTLLALGNDQLKVAVEANLEKFIQIFPPESISEEVNHNLTLLTNEQLPLETKEAYLSKQQNKVSDLSSIENDFVKPALSTNIITPTWKNIEHYLNIHDDVEDGNLQRFITLNTEALSKACAYDEITDTVCHRLYQFYITEKKDLEFDNFKLLLNSFDRIMRGWSLSNLSLEKVEYLIEKKKIRFNEYYLLHISSEFNSLLPQFIKLHCSHFVQTAEEYTYNAYIAEVVLCSDVLNINDKKVILPYIVNHIKEDERFCNEACNVIGKTNCTGIAEGDLLTIFDTAKETDYKLKAVVEFYKLQPSIDSTLQTLTMLGGNYTQIASQTGLRPKFDLTDENRAICEHVRKVGLITSFKIENNTFRAMVKSKLTQQ